jgi:predicted outer membrane repeat protein
MPPLPNNYFSKQLDATNSNLFDTEVDIELEVSYRTNIITSNRTMNDNITNHLQQRRSLQDFCVNDEIEFRNAIANAPNVSPMTRIDICVPSMNIDGRIPDISYQGIGIQFKNLDIRCNTTTPKCILNAQNLSRHFYFNQSTVVFRGMIFQNGNGHTDIVKTRAGGSLLVNNSMISFDRCQFRNNIGTEGGAIRAESSNVTFLGGNVTHPTLFENNLGTIGGGAISAVGFTPTITAVDGYIVFRNNSVSTKGVSLNESFLFLMDIYSD